MSKSDDETSIGMPRLFNHTWGRFTNQKRYKGQNQQNSYSYSNNQQITTLQQNMAKMYKKMQTMQRTLHSLSVQGSDTQSLRAPGPIAQNFLNSNNDGNYRFMSNDVQINTRGMSRIHQTEYVNKNDSDCFLEKVKTSEIYK